MQTDQTRISLWRWLCNLFLEVYDRVPALPAFILFVSARCLGFHVISISLVVLVGLLWRRKSWWLILISALGIYGHTMDQKRNHYWQELMHSKGFVNMVVQWDEDVYLSTRDNSVSGWAWVWPATESGSSLKKRWWLKCRNGSELKRDKLMLGASFETKLFMDGSEKRSLQCSLPEGNKVNYSWSFKFRSQLVERLETTWEKHHQQERAALMRGMLTGNRDGISSELHSGFSRLGLLHLLALSGLHVGVLYMFLSMLFSGSRNLKMHGRILAFLVVVIYGFMGGWAYSLKRAVCMCGLSIWAIDLGRKYRLLNVLCFLALVEVVLDVGILYSLSFQLSYLGVLGIGWSWYVFKPGLQKEMNSIQQIKQKLLNSYRTTWGAMLFTWPVVAMRFLLVPTWVWLFSLPLLVLFTFVVIGSFLGACFTLLGFSVPELLWFPLEGYSSLVSWVSTHFSWVQAIDSVQAMWMFPYYLGLFGFVIWRKIHVEQQSSKSGTIDENPSF